jgi:hypothetical protein
MLTNNIIINSIILSLHFGCYKFIANAGIVAIAVLITSLSAQKESVILLVLILRHRVKTKSPPKICWAVTDMMSMATALWQAFAETSRALKLYLYLLLYHQPQIVILVKYKALIARLS